MRLPRVFGKAHGLCDLRKAMAKFNVMRRLECTIQDARAEDRVWVWEREDGTSLMTPVWPNLGNNDATAEAVVEQVVEEMFDEVVECAFDCTDTWEGTIVKQR